jgi:hypothetical protein
VSGKHERQSCSDWQPTCCHREEDGKPDMDRVEVLAHKTAPSRAVDDARYRAAAAAAVADFESCSRVRIFGSEDDLTGSGRKAPPSNIVNTVVPSPARVVSSLSPPRKIDIGQQRVQERPLGDQCLGLQWSNSEQYSPHAKLLQESLWSSARFTELFQALRPKPAQEGSIASKRTRSESSSFESLLSVVPDSQARDTKTHQQDPMNLQTDTTVSDCRIAHIAARTSISDRASKYGARPVKRRRTGCVGRLCSQPALPRPALSNTRTGTIIPILHEKSFTPDTMLDEIIEPEVPVYSSRPQRDEYLRVLPSAVLTLSQDQRLSLSSVATSKTKHHTSCTPRVLWPPKSLDHQLTILDSTRSLSTLHAPTAAHAPSPQIIHSGYTTHLTRSLSALASRLPTAKFFRPISTTREIHSSERGHWALHIPVMLVINQSPTAPARTSLSSASNDTSQISWTESQFIQFFRSLSSFIRSGCAGWGVSIYQAPTPSNRAPPDHATTVNSTTVILKITCWGEIVPHMYLAMWVLSDKRVGRLDGVVWKDAKGGVLVEMAGGEAHDKCKR